MTFLAYLPHWRHARIVVRARARSRSRSVRMVGVTCLRCGDPVEHPETHPDACCDCFDLRWGMSLAKLNAERAARGAPPLEWREGDEP